MLADSMIPKVSVIMLARNSQGTIAQAIESLLAQTLKDFEIIVIDGGSTDQTLSILSGYQDPRLRISPQTGRGLGHARSQGISEARATLIAYLDSDDVAQPQRLEKQLHFLETHPDYVLVGSWLTLIDENSKKITDRHYPSKHEDIVRAMGSFNPIANPGVMFRKQAVIQAGGYTEVLPEDYDLWFRMLGQGKFYNLPEFLTLYRIHTQGSKLQTTRMQQWVSLKVRYHYWRQGIFKLTLSSCLNNIAQLLIIPLPPALVVWAFRTAVKLRRL